MCHIDDASLEACLRIPVGYIVLFIALGKYFLLSNSASLANINAVVNEKRCLSHLGQAIFSRKADSQAPQSTAWPSVGGRRLQFVFSWGGEGHIKTGLST